MRLLVPGKIIVLNVITVEIPRRIVNMIQPGSIVVFVNDTDVEKTDVLKKNIKRINAYVERAKVVHLAQVLNSEDEIIRSTDVKKVQELTKSLGVNNFKADFCRMKATDCRNALERHYFDISLLWIKEPPKIFHFVEQGGELIKIR